MFGLACDVFKCRATSLSWIPQPSELNFLTLSRSKDFHERCPFAVFDLSQFAIF